jgi:hypothetical protein
MKTVYLITAYDALNNNFFFPTVCVFESERKAQEIVDSINDNDKNIKANYKAVYMNEEE